MKNKITSTLKQIEKERYIKILYACEAGSRAWGFSSKDSDYDIRFIYVNPIEWYLSINEKPHDTINLIQKDLDIEGWELRKTLRLLRKCNPSLLEWLNSDTIYILTEFYDYLYKLSKRFYNSKSSFYHYLHMAKGNIREYLKGRTEVWLKKYLYVVRPLFACNYIEQFSAMPPVNFEQLIDKVEIKKDWSMNLKTDIKDLIARKKNGEELSYGPIIPSIHNFIEIELERLFDISKDIFKICKKNIHEQNDILNIAFREILQEVLRWNDPYNNYINLME